MRGKFADYLENSQQDLFRFLKEMVLQQSYTGNKTGVDAVGDLISRELNSLPLHRLVIKQHNYGNHLVFKSPACNDETSPILLVGHMDTVFPPDSGFDSYREQGNHVYGPGVIDMKGGLAVAVYTLKALHHVGLLEQIPLVLICNSDEETGSPSSRELIIEEAKKSLLGLVFECGGLNGEVVTSRKGKSGFKLNVTGKAGHAAFASNNKPSAILELSRKIVAIEKLNNPAQQLVVNVGVIEGGIGPNTIAEHASALIDTRYCTIESGNKCIDAIGTIAKTCEIQGTTGSIEETSCRMPMEESNAINKLYSHLLEEAGSLAIPLPSELRSGVSDANTIAGARIPVVDGLGPIGDCDHSDKEYMLRDSLPERTLLSACSIASSWHKHNSGELQFM